MNDNTHTVREMLKAFNDLHKCLQNCKAVHLRRQVIDLVKCQDAFFVLEKMTDEFLDLRITDGRIDDWMSNHVDLIYREDKLPIVPQFKTVSEEFISHCEEIEAEAKRICPAMDKIREEVAKHAQVVYKRRPD